MGASGRVLVTGASGFVGGCMVPALREKGFEVHGTSLSGAGDCRAVDLSDRDGVNRLVHEVAPCAVIHLGGMTYLPEVFEKPEQSFRANVLGTQNLLGAVGREAPLARVLVVSTCSVYGSPQAEDLPLKEDAPLRALHPYGVQKIGVEVLAHDARTAAGLDTVVVRPFNHVGPEMNPRLSLAFFAGQIVAAERGEKDPVMRVGNLQARRDLTDVRDVVRAYLGILEHPEPPPLLNVASGRSLAIGEVLERMISRARVSLTVETDPARMRPLDTPDLVGDATRLHELTGWKPEIPLDETLERILVHARGEDYGGAW